KAGGPAEVRSIIARPIDRRAKCDWPGPEKVNAPAACLLGRFINSFALARFDAVQHGRVDRCRHCRERPVAQALPYVFDRGLSRQGQETFPPERLLTTRCEPTIELAVYFADCPLEQIAGPLFEDPARAGNGGSERH